MGKDTDERIKYAMDFGIPMKFVFKTPSICKGKSIKNPNRCRKYKTCKVVRGRKRSYCRKNKNTRKTNTETTKTFYKDTAKTETRKKETFRVCNTNSYI